MLDPSVGSIIQWITLEKNMPLSQKNYITVFFLSSVNNARQLYLLPGEDKGHREGIPHQNRIVHRWTNRTQGFIKATGVTRSIILINRQWALEIPQNVILKLNNRQDTMRLEWMHHTNAILRLTNCKSKWLILCAGGWYVGVPVAFFSRGFLVSTAQGAQI